MGPESKKTAWFISATDVAAMPFMKKNMSAYDQWYTGFENGRSYF